MVIKRPELGIVLLGPKRAGKSSSGNTILGREAFRLRRTTQSVKRQGEVAGRQVVVVDTPGWWENVSATHTPVLVKQEMFYGVSLCPQGPNVLLLVLQIDFNLKEVVGKAFIEHMLLFSERVWKNSIVLFTKGECLGDKTIEQYIESEGKALQELLEKCGNRYHVFNNQEERDGTQVTELLEKIESLAGNVGQHFEIDRMVAQELEERKRTSERAQKRRMNVKKQRTTLKSSEELRLVLLGWKTAGKSSSGNTILGSEEFKLGTTSRCVKRQGRMAGRRVTVIDTPGWWRDVPSVYTPEFVKQEVVRSVSLCSPGPHVLLLVVCVDMSFPAGYKEAVKKHLRLLGERAWRHTIVLFTCGNCLGSATIEQYIESEGGDLRWLVEKCGSRYHVFDNKSRADGSQVTELLEKIEEMVAGNRGRHYMVDRKMIKETRAEQNKPRVMEVQRQRDGNPRAAELRMVLLGYGHAGKSSSGNTILGRKEFSSRTAECVTGQGHVAGRQVTVVDTPGWWMSLFFSQPPDEQKRGVILSGASLFPTEPHALLLVLRLDLSFTEKERKDLEAHVRPLGDAVWNGCMVLFTYGDFLGDRSIERYIESEGRALQWLVEKCGNRYHVFNNKSKGDGSQVTELLEKIEEMVAGQPLGHAQSIDIPLNMSGSQKSPSGSSTSSLTSSGYATQSTDSGRSSGSRWISLQKLLQCKTKDSLLQDFT
ncbi:GTPase IMAP family member 8-like [Centroberyx affinis]|uniref:GTPase IMAP family member 8-like n=1 Tax=Centroberyx affinis TaxID=166261 RepID=UPI003A5BC8EC